MAVNHSAFGQWLRKRRVAKGYSLRKFAEQVGFSATYLSHVELGKSAPPTTGRIERIASLLDENADEMITLAGRFPEDLPEIIQRRPKAMLELLRETRDLAAEELRQVIEQIRKLKEKRGL
jgi:transcriptional regulator with XRE-family HTH domain